MSSTGEVEQQAETSSVENVPETIPCEPDVFTFEGQVLRVCFQPKTDKDGSILSYEALTKSIGSQHAPVELLHNAEKKGTLHALTLEVFRRTCEQVAVCSASKDVVPVSVNISPTELKPGIVAELEAILKETGVDSKLIELEITEHYPIEERHYDVLQSLHNLGVNIAIDDYGSGHATAESLARIREHGPYIKTVKVDRQLLLDGEAVEVAQQLIDDGYKVVVEGVEHKEQAEALPDACILQGHAYGATVPASQIARTLLQ